MPRDYFSEEILGGAAATQEAPQILQDQKRDYFSEEILGDGPQDSDQTQDTEQAGKTFQKALSKSFKLNAYIPNSDQLNALGESAAQGAAGAAKGVLGISEAVWRTPELVGRATKYLSKNLPQNSLESIALKTLNKTGVIDKSFESTSHVADEIGVAARLLPELHPVFARNDDLSKQAESAMDEASKYATSLGKRGDPSKLLEVVTNPNAWASFIGQAVPSLYLAFQSGGSLGFIAWLEASEAANDAAHFEKMTGIEMDDAQFTQAVAQAGIINAVFEKIGLKSITKQWKAGAGNLLKAMMAAGVPALTEGFTEGMQALNSNLAKLLNYNEKQKLTEGILQSVMGGFGAGGAAGGAGSLIGSEGQIENVAPKFSQEVIPGIEPALEGSQRPTDAPGEAIAPQVGPAQAEEQNQERRFIEKILNKELLAGDLTEYEETKKLFKKFPHISEAYGRGELDRFIEQRAQSKVKDLKKKQTLALVEITDAQLSTGNEGGEVGVVLDELVKEGIFTSEQAQKIADVLKKRITGNPEEILRIADSSEQETLDDVLNKYRRKAAPPGPTPLQQAAQNLNPPAPSGEASTGGYADVPIEDAGPQPLTLAHLQEVVPLQLPEMLSFTREVSGQTPTVGKFRSPNILGRHKSGQIRLNPEIFKDPVLAAKVFAHEIGHLADFLPEGTMKRGNLLGRAIVSTNTFLKESFGDLSNRAMRKELKELTQFWKPFDESLADKKFTSYRYSSKELYADFVSVLLNNPQAAKRIAPTFTEAFFEHLDKKPEVRHEYARLQQLMYEPDDTLLAEREGRILEGYLKASEAANLIRANAMARKKSFWFAVKNALFADAALRDLAKKTLPSSEAGRVNMRAEDMAIRSQKVEARTVAFGERVWKPLQAAGLKPSDLGVYIQLTRVALGDRSPMANPEGFDPQTAKRQLDFLRKRLGDQAYAQIESLGREVRGWYKEISSDYPDLFTEEQKKTIEGNDYYAPFQVIDYLENWISAGFAHQVGTLKSIRNPLDSLVMKSVSIIMTGEKNAITKDNMTSLLPHSSEKNGLMRAEVKMLEGKHPHVRPKTGFKPILWKENGKWQAAYAEPFVADSFNSPDNRAMGMTAKVLSTLFANKFFRASFITLSSGFQSVNFLVRDPGRTWANLGIRPFKNYKASFGPAIRRLKGEFDPLIQKMLKEGALQTTLNDLLLEGKDGEGRYENEIDAIFAKYGGMEQEGNRNLIQRIFNAIRFAGDILETVPKVAAYQELSAKNVQAQLRAYQVTHYVGTPRRRPGQAHAIYNNAFLFSEMFKEGYRSDIEVATHPKTRMGWWLRSLSITVLPAFASALALAGYFGDDIKKRLQGVSEYIKTNYNVFTLGEDENGKPLNLTLPIPDTQRVLHGIAWKIFSAFIPTLEDIRLGKKEIRPPDFKGRKLMQLFAFGAGALPSPAPMIELMGAWSAYMTGGEPRDLFRDQPILTRDELNAGGIDALRPMWLWTINQSGFTKFDLHTRPEDKQSSLERFLNWGAGINRFLRVSDYGITEGLREAKQDTAKEEARERLMKKRLIAQGLNEDKSRLEIQRDLIRHLGLTRREVKKQRSGMKQSIKRSRAYASDDPILRAVTSAQTNAQKKAVLLKARERFANDEEFLSYLRGLKNKNFISRPLNAEIAKSLRSSS